MPVSKTPGGSTLKLILETGVDANGKPVSKTKSFDGLKPTASDQDIYELGQALSDLQKYSLSKVLRAELGELTQE